MRIFVLSPESMSFLNKHFKRQLLVVSSSNLTAYILVIIPLLEVILIMKELLKNYSL